MGEEQLQKIYEAMTSDSGVVVKFTSDSQLTPLKAVLMDVFNKGNKGLQNSNEGIKKELSKKAKEDAKALSGVKKAVEKVESAVESSKGGMFSFMKSGNFWLKAGQMMLGAASMLIDYGKQYYGNLKKLSDAGVRIAEGFDKAYGAYAAVANMSHENFAKLLIQNKRFVTRMNSVADNTMSGARLIAEMSSRINGRFSLDEEQTGTILEFFGEITNSMSRRKLTDNYLTNQAEKLAETMNGLSKAVGMSIEQFKEKVKMDEQDLAERRIMRDPRARGRYMLNKATMGKDAALYLETGIPNEKVLNMMGNPTQLAFLQKMFQANQKTNSLDKKQLLDYAKIYTSNMRLYVDSVRENFDKQQAAFLGLSGEWGQGQYGSMSFLDISAEMMAKAMDESDIENKTVDGINMLNRTVDVIKDLLVYQVFKNSGKSVAEALKFASQGSDSIKKFILGDEYEKFNADLKGWDLEKINELKRIASGEKKHFWNDAITDEQREAASKELTEIVRSKMKDYLKEGKYDQFTSDVIKYADMAVLADKNKQIHLVNRESLNEYNNREEFKKYMNFKELYKKNKLERSLFGLGLDYVDKDTGEVVMSMSELSKLEDKYKYNENAILQKSLLDTEKEVSELYYNTEKIGDKVLIQILEKIDDKLVNILDVDKQTAKNTGEQAEQAKEANEQMKSENADNNRGKYHGVPGAVPIGAM